jgi:ribosomal protein L29
MKRTKINDELRGLGVQELQVHIALLRKSLLTLRLNKAAAHVKDYSQFSKIKRTIARALTHLQQKSHSV